MRLPFSIFLALKYLRPKRALLSVISILAVTGVLLGVAILVVVLSVMNGFDDMWSRKILSFNAHITVTGYGPLENYDELIEEIEQVEGVTAAAPYVQGLVFLQRNKRVYTPLIRGVIPAYEEKVSQVPKFIEHGEYAVGDEELIIGVDLARQMNIAVGDEVLVYSPQNFASADTLRLPEEFTVTGIFDVGMWEFDMGYVMTSMEAAGSLYDVEGSAHGIQVMTEDAQRASLTAALIREKLRPIYHVETWMEQNRQLFGALRVEKNMMLILLIFISIVAGFAVCNSLIMVAIQKTRDIGLLKALGFSSRNIMNVFFWQGWMAGLVGCGLGLGVGLLFLEKRNDFLRWISDTFNRELFPKELYHLAEIPARVEVGDLVLVVSLVMLMCTFAGVIPAWRAARLDPVKGLRYE